MDNALPNLPAGPLGEGHYITGGHLLQTRLRLGIRSKKIAQNIVKSVVYA